MGLSTDHAQDAAEGAGFHDEERELSVLPKGAPYLTFDDLVVALTELGLARGDQLMVHSSLRRVGPVLGGADVIIRALMQVVGKGGLLVMPSFNHGAPFRSGGVGYFDPAETPSESGALTERFWHWPGVARQVHPTHAFVAWGAGAADLMADSGESLTLGLKSPLARLVAANGWLLHLGTDHLVSTAKHLAERMAGATCIADLGDLFEVRLQGQRRKLPTFRYRASDCPHTDDREVMEQLVRGLREERSLTLGRTQARMIRLAPFVRAVKGMLADGRPGVSGCAGCKVSIGHPEGYDGD